MKERSVGQWKRGSGVINGRSFTYSRNRSQVRSGEVKAVSGKQRQSPKKKQIQKMNSLRKTTSRKFFSGFFSGVKKIPTFENPDFRKSGLLKIPIFENPNF